MGLPEHEPTSLVHKEAPAPDANDPPQASQTLEASPARKWARKFFHAYVSILGLYLTFRVCYLTVWHWDKVYEWYRGQPPTAPLGLNSTGNIAVCTEYAKWTPITRLLPSLGHTGTFGMRTRFILPADRLDGLFLQSLDDYSYGRVYFAESPTVTNVEVRVEAFFDAKGALDQRTVCSLRRERGDYGTGIFLNGRPGPRDKLDLRITVLLPKSHLEADPVLVPRLETYLPQFYHTFGDLSTHTFGEISLLSQDAPIEMSTALTAERARITARHGYIKARLNVFTSLEAKSVDSPIFVAVSAFNDGDGNPTDVHISTTNSHIIGQFALLSTRADRAGGGFNITALTSQSPLELRFTEQALNSDLTLNVHSSGAISDVYLHPAYEGTFELLSGGGPAHLDVDPKVRDPAGRGRTRQVASRTVGRGARLIRGDVAWVPRYEETLPNGSVRLVSAPGGVRLFL
ncbi:hypothetical protein BC834DRAFT_889159 [Gloeopeniophorella convolvens]|nr:hypothetical protein BC834DRAFT_889159 [Gloeopeniophorella convolvens]